MNPTSSRLPVPPSPFLLPRARGSKTDMPPIQVSLINRRLIHPRSHLTHPTYKSPKSPIHTRRWQPTYYFRPTAYQPAFGVCARNQYCAISTNNINIIHQHTTATAGYNCLSSEEVEHPMPEYGERATSLCPHEYNRGINTYCLPQFVGIGVQKSGSTTLFAAISRHPQMVRWACCCLRLHHRCLLSSSSLLFAFNVCLF